MDEDRPIFRHSGHCGDFVYALASVRAAGGGVVAVDHRRELPGKPALTDEMGRWMVELADSQPYARARFLGPGDAVDFDLDLFRGQAELFDKPLTLSHWDAVGRPGKLDLVAPWLDVPANRVAPIVIHWKRSWFAHDPRFPWDVLERRRRDCAFVGLRSEHRDFRDAFGWSPDFYESGDVLGLCRAIAGASFFVGVASLPLAIAEALKVPRVPCQPRDFCNTQPAGRGGHAWLDESVLGLYLP